MDWKSTIADLQALGMSQPQIAAVCGCGQATISDLASGKTQDPRHSLGQNLIALLAKAKADAASTDTASGEVVRGEVAEDASGDTTHQAIPRGA